MPENLLDEQLSRGEHRAQPELLMPHTVLARTAADLAAKYEGVVSRQTVERCVFESYTALRRTSRVHAHLTTLAGRFAADRLRALAQSDGSVPKDVPEVLFVCVQNAGRSQMAAGLLTHHATGRVHVRSAGSAPAHSINPTVVEAMTEIGVDLGTQYPKPLTDDVVAAADVVVAMGCGDACPIYPGKRYLDWTVSDPQGRPSTRFARSATILTPEFVIFSPNSPPNVCDVSDVPSQLKGLVSHVDIST